LHQKARALVNRWMGCLPAAILLKRSVTGKFQLLAVALGCLKGALYQERIPRGSERRVQGHCGETAYLGGLPSLGKKAHVCHPLDLAAHARKFGA
jgi:hypothetical protein